MNSKETPNPFSEGLLSILTTLLFSIREDNQKIDRNRLPEKIPGHIGDIRNFEELFELANFFWEKVFEKETVINKLQTYIDNQNTTLNSSLEIKRYLKSLRKPLMILSSINHFINENPNLSYELTILLRLIGSLNDFFLDENGKEIAKELIEFIENNNFKTVELKIIDNNVCQNRIKIMVEQILKFVNTPDIYIKDFHKLRKDLRHIMTFYQLRVLKHPESHDDQQIFQYLIDLVVKLGKKHDEILKMTNNGEINYESDKTQISNELKGDIIYFCSKLNQILNKANSTQLPSTL